MQKSEITATVEMITPEKAAEYLRKNVDNSRKLSKAKARQYAEDIKAGHWQLNGQTIVFSRNGNLKDGQHRLAAILYAGMPVKMTVIRGVDDDINIFDVGMQRTSAQLAKARGVDLPRQAIAAANIVVNRFNPAPKGTETDYVEKNQHELARAYRLSCLGMTNFSKRTSSVAAAYLMLRTESIKSYELEMFFRVFNTGETRGTDGYDASSALVARRMFEERFEGKRNSTAIREQLEILVLAMTDFHEGVNRTENYKIMQPFHFDELITEVRIADGLERVS